MKTIGGTSSNFKALIISGVTGTGKTKLATALARNLGGELICGDITHMYKGLPLLTNKTLLF